MNILDLFSGIGGFRLAAEMAGWTFANEYHSEINEYALRVYQRHYPESFSLGDIRGINGYALRGANPGPWVLCGGFPCYGMSAAGKRRGLEDPRSALWWEYKRLIDEIRPALIVAENSAHLRTRGLDVVIESLTSLGYDAWWDCLSAGAFGAPHQRDRLWIVATPSESGSAAHANLHDLGDVGLLRQLACGRDLGDESKFAQPIAGDPAWLNWQGLARRWCVAGRPLVRRVGDGLPIELDAAWRGRGVCLGNAIVPQVAAFLFRMIEHVGLKPTSEELDTSA